MKIVFILGSYKPDPCPNANCIDNILEEIKRKFDICIICSRKKINEKHEEVIDGVRVLRVDDWRLLARDWCALQKSKKHTLFKKVLILIASFLVWLINGVLFMFAWPDASTAWTKKAYKCLIDANRAHEFDCVVSISFPFEAHLVAYRFKKKNPKINWVAYTFDPFSTNLSVLASRPVMKLFRYKSVRAENEVFSLADSLLITPELKEEYLDGTFSRFKEKTRVIGLPLIRDIRKTRAQEAIIPHDGRIKLVYTGTFYRAIRNPRYFFEVFKRINADGKFVLHLFSWGDCDDIIEEYERSFKEGCIVKHGRVAISKAHAAMCDADILINIGNDMTNQAPSKILEYISAGKPIVNFYRNPNDTSNVYLKNYPLYIAIKEDSDKINEKAETFRNFCLKNAGKHIEYEIIAKIYEDNTPQKAAQILQSIISLQPKT